MVIIRKIRKIFMFPNTFLMSIINALGFWKMYSDEIRSDINNINLNKYEVFIKANNMMFARMDLVKENMALISKKLGIMKYVISASFWYLIYTIIF